MTRDVFVLASPLQALNAIEAVAVFEIERPVAVLVECASEESNRQVRSILEAAGWQDLRPIHIRQGRFRKRLTNVAEVVAGLLAEPVGRLFIGFYADIFLHMAHTVPHAELYLLDDGIATITLNQARMRGDFNGFPVPTHKRIARDLLLRAVDGFRIGPIERVRYFTIYERLGEDERNLVHRHSMARLRSTRATVPQTDEVWFLGLGSERIFRHPDLLIAAMRQVVGELGAGRVRYIPHRHESAAMVERIERECGCPILRTNAPIELYLAQRSDTIPAEVASFLSSALYTICVLFPETIRIASYRLDLAQVNRRYHSQFRGIYDYYERCPFIDVRPLDTPVAAPIRRAVTGAV